MSIGGPASQTKSFQRPLAVPGALASQSWSWRAPKIILALALEYSNTDASAVLAVINWTVLSCAKFTDYFHKPVMWSPPLPLTFPLASSINLIQETRSIGRAVLVFRLSGLFQINKLNFCVNGRFLSLGACKNMLNNRLPGRLGLSHDKKQPPPFAEIRIPKASLVQFLINTYLIQGRWKTLEIMFCCTRTSSLLRTTSNMSYKTLKQTSYKLTGVTCA